MEQFNLIPSQGNWNDAASLLNTNFLRAYTQLVKLFNSTNRYKGVFPSLEKLQAAVLSPVKGDWAYIGSGFPMPVYIYDGAWKVNGSGNGGDSVDAVNAAKLAAIKDIVEQAGQYLPITEDGWLFTDKEGRQMVSITNEGFDAAAITAHFRQLLEDAGIAGDLEYEVISEVDY